MNANESKQLTFRIPKSDYEKLIKVFGPHVKIAAIIREQVQKLIQQKEQSRQPQRAA